MKKREIGIMITIFLLVICALLQDIRIPLDSGEGTENGGATDDGTVDDGTTEDDGAGEDSGNTDEEEAIAAEKAAKYAEAMEKLASGEHEAAYALLKELGDYEDALAHLSRFDTFFVGLKDGWDEESGLYDSGFAMVLNAQGLPERITVKGEEGETVYLFAYGEGGLLLGQTVTHPQGGETRTVYFYDEEGRRVKITHQTPDGDYETELAYDEMGNVVQAEDTGSENRLIFYTYDEEGRLTEIRTREQDGTEYVCEYAYDEDGNCVREWVETPEKTTLIQRIYEKGRLVEEALGDENGIHTIARTTYDGQGRAFRKTVTTREGQLVSHYAYDESGRLTAMVETDPKDETRERVTTFSYDEAGRLLRTETVTADGETVVSERSYLFAYRATALPTEVAELLGALQPAEG